MTLCTSWRFAVVCFVLSALCVCHADDFEIEDLDDEVFSLRRGASGCPTELKFKGEERELHGNDINADGRSCTGNGTVRLERNPDSGGTALTEFLRQPKIRGDRDDSYEGMLRGSLNCDNYIMSNTYFQFFSPEKDLNVDLAGLFPTPSHPLAQVGNTFEFKEERDYFVLSDQCLYDRTVTGRWCFPSAAKVSLRSGEGNISSLSIGDEVLVAPGVYSPVFMWTHFDPKFMGRAYVRIGTESGRSLTLTLTHHVYIAERSESLPAGRVRVGDALISASGGIDRITSFSRVASKGLFNPQTIHGDIVVDGFIASTYTAAVSPELAHSLLSPLRGIYKVFLQTFIVR